MHSAPAPVRDHVPYFKPMIDTHSHIYIEEFDTDREEMILRAREAGVERILMPAIDSESHERLFELGRTCSPYCIPMMGVHPTSVNDNPHWLEELRLVERYLAAPPDGLHFCGVGEIGLDFYWNTNFKTEQIEVFRRQIELALAYDLPIAVHTRSAWPETVELMQEYSGRGLRGVFHAYSDTVETYRTLKGYGDFVFGIGGVVTFKKSALAGVVREMDLADIVLETDCPYLSPVPHRGERNEPAYVRFVCGKVAELKACSSGEVAARTTENARRMFCTE